MCIQGSVLQRNPLPPSKRSLPAGNPCLKQKESPTRHRQLRYRPCSKGHGLQSRSRVVVQVTVLQSRSLSCSLGYCVVVKVTVLQSRTLCCSQGHCFSQRHCVIGKNSVLQANLLHCSQGHCCSLGHLCCRQGQCVVVKDAVLRQELCCWQSLLCSRGYSVVIKDPVVNKVTLCRQGHC